MSTDAITYVGLARLQARVADLTAQNEELLIGNGILRASIERLEATAARTERHRVDL